MNPAVRRFEWGVSIHADLTISWYDGSLASLYELHDVTLNRICRDRMNEALQSTISSSIV